MLVSLLVLMAFYVSAYIAVIDTTPFFVRTTNSLRIRGAKFIMHENGSVVLTAKPKYRIGGAWALTLFAPVHQIDRRVRPDIWELRLSELPPVVD